MAFGLDTAENLNSSNFNWANFHSWKEEWPQFVGRYFGGGYNATAGEFTAFKTTTGGKCLYVLPIQGCQQSRQETSGSTGVSYGIVDAKQTIGNINKFLSSGELVVPPSSEIYVYLDVEPGVHLTPAYWAGWANQIFTMKDPSGSAVFWPAVYAQFVENSSNLWVLNSLVANALNKACSDWPSYSGECYALWPAQPEYYTARRSVLMV